MEDKVRRQELGDFVRTRRERVSPLEAGLGPGTKRRTPGLRREEVALLAGVSVTWFTWLEQGRAINVSAQVLESLARVLRLDAAERARLFMLTRQPLPPQAASDAEVPAALRRVLDSLEHSPAYIVGHRWDVLGWNRVAREVFGDFGTQGGGRHERNLVWLSFTSSEWRQRIVQWDAHAQCVLAQFRASYGKHTGDPLCDDLVLQLQQRSEEFASWWPRHDVREVPGGRKEVRHPDAGLLVLEDSLFQVAGSPDLRLFLYTPLDEEDTPEKLRRLVHPRKPSRKREVSPSA